MVYYVQGFFHVVLEILCCKLFYETFGEKRTENTKWNNSGIVISLIVVVYVIANFLQSYFFAKQILIIIFTAVLMRYYLNISFLKSLILSALYQGLLLVVDYFTMLLNVTVLHSMTIMEKNYYVQGSLLVALGKVILFLVVLLLRKLMAKDSLAGLADTEWLRFIFFPVFTVFTISAMISTAGNIQNQTQENVFVSIAFGLAGMNIVVFYLIKDILKREARISEDRIFRLQVENQTSMYRSVSENFDKQRKKTHEYKNQMLCIEALIKKKRYEELEGYVEGICEKLNKDLDSISTNNVIVDAILNTKYQEMIDKNMVFVFKINDLSPINIKDEDIVIVLSNLLNNAIEACEKCKEKRIVKLKFVNEDDMVIISVRNTYESEIIYDGEEILTSKSEDIDEHGIGIKNIIETIEKYQGSYVITNDEQEFCFSIIIPQG